MIDSVVFKKKVRDMFSKGESVSLRPFTVMVGDNGTGKSTFLTEVASSLGKKGSVRFSESGHALSRVLFYDFEKDNARMQSGDFMTSFGMFSRMTVSHGETMMKTFVHFSGFKDCLMLLDEPDQCLSPRSAYRMYAILDRLVRENGCQVIMSCHSVPVMEMAGEVYSMEHRRWMRYEDFLRSQKEEKHELRWVDDCERYQEPYVVATMDDGSERYWCRDNGLGGPLEKGARNAVVFKSKEAARKKADSLVGRKFVFREFGNRKTLAVVSARVVMLEKSFG